MKQVKTGDYVHEMYDSLADYADVALTRVGRQRDKGPTDWNGDVSFAEAVELAKTGWTDELPDALALAEGNIKTLRDMGLIPTPTPVWDVAGSEVDVARFLSGEPENMIEFPPADRKRAGQVVRLVKSGVLSGGYSADELKQHGRMVVALAMAINAMGLNVEVWVDMPNGRNEGASLYQCIPVKQAADTLDPGQLMFALAHPALLRQVAFGHYDKIPGKVGQSVKSAGRGHVRTRTIEEQKAFGPEAIILESLHWKEQKNGGTVTFLIRELKKLGLIESE